MSAVSVTRKIKLCPSKEQEVLLYKTATAFTNACTFVAQWCMEYRSTGRKTVHDGVYYEIRERFHLPSQMAISAIRTTLSAYKTIHAQQPRWSVTPTFKRQRYDVVWNRDYTVNKKTGHFSVNTVAGRQVIPTEWTGHERYAGREKYGSATISYRHGHWFIHVPVDVETREVSLDDIADIVGIDLGINFLATTYNSAGKTAFYSGKEVKNTRARYKSRRASLQRKQTRSSRKRLLEMGSRENRWMRDINHCVTKALVNTDTPTLFVMEDLTGIRAATEQVRLRHRYVHVSWAFYQFRQLMEYKAQRYGHQIIFVDPAHTSQRCPQCGHTHKSNRNRKQHIFCCKRCGYTSNDDRIAAMNLHNMGIQYRMQCDTCIPSFVRASVNSPECSITSR